MGAVAGRLSDVVVITSDNPRSEDPAAHHRGGQARHAAAERSHDASGTERRVSHGPEVLAIVDRREAIDARGRAGRQPGDLVLIAGKGHEKTR